MNKELGYIYDQLSQGGCANPSAERLRQARDRFDALLRARRSRESEWQTLFADCPYILSTSLPLKLSPADILPLGRPGISEPDLIFYPRRQPSLHHSYGVIELKTPYAKVLRVPRKNVITLSASATTAIAQGRAYLQSHPYSKIFQRSKGALFVGNPSYAFVIMGLVRELQEALASDILKGQFSSLLPPNFQIFPYDYLYDLFTATVPPKIMTLIPDYKALWMREQIRRVLATLSPREERILRMRFGIGQNNMLEEVGQEFGVMAARIRQIEGRAPHKLKERGPSSSTVLRK